MKRLFSLLLALLLCLSLGTAAQASNAGQTLRVHVLGIGQGDAVFLQLPGGKSMLIDAGNPGDGGAILAYLKENGCQRLDYLVATHPHADHIGGMREVLLGIPVGAVYMPAAISDTKTFTNLLQAIKDEGLSIKVAKAGVALPAESVGGKALRMSFVSPVLEEYEGLNNYSAVMRVSYGEKSFLFTGDAEAQAEGLITAEVKADVLKVGHHGSSTSTSQGFLSKVAPSYAAISVGEGNTYGHPAESTLAKLEKAGAKVYRTDEDGTIVFTTDGDTITVEKKPGLLQGQKAPAKGGGASALDREASSSAAPATDPQGDGVVINRGTKKFHKPSCPTVGQIKEGNRGTAPSREEALAQGYAPCKRCNP